MHKTPSNVEDLNVERIHQLALQRLYHEDNLLTQRMYNFLTFNVFVGALLVVGGTSAGKLNDIGYLMSTLGALIATIQTALGRRTEKAITFWCEYIRLIEKKSNIPLDHLLFDFYKGGNQNGEVITPWGNIGRKESNRSAIYDTWPWTWMPSTNIAIGILLPFLITTLWLFTPFIALMRSQRYLFALFPVAIWIALIIFTWFYPLPATPSAKE